MRPIVSLFAALSIASFVGATDFSVSVSLVGRTTIQFDVGCVCDEDCKDRCSFDAVCLKNMCVMKDAVPTSTECTTSPSSVVIAPASRTTHENVIGCSCDDDCKGLYPYDTVCKMNMCVKDATTKTTTMTMPCSTPSSSVLAPTSRTTHNNVVSTPCSAPPSMIVAPASRTTYILPFGCSCDEDCKGRYPYDTVCKMNICVKVEAEPTTICSTPPSVTLAPISRTTQNQHVSCTCDADCEPGYCCENGICKKMATAEPSMPASTPCSTPSSVIAATTSRTTQQHNVGCACDEDCSEGYTCEHNICVKKATVPTTPCSTSPSNTVLPTSRTTQQHNVGCTCDEDCGEGYYCDHNICIKKAIVLPTTPTTPCPTSPSVTVLPVSRTTQQNNVGCTCDQDCGDDYYCEHNICIKKATVLPTQRTTSTECTTTPTFTVLPDHTTLSTTVKPTTPTTTTTLPTFTNVASRNNIGWCLAMGAVVALLV